MQVVILAGGKGTRLRPFTNIIPKPLVPLGDMPILEVVLRQLHFYGCDRIVLAVNHLAELIMSFFGDGSKYGLQIEYSVEDKPLGTAGALSLIKEFDENFFVMNGDILTTIDYRALYERHITTNADITVSAYPKEVKIDLGVLEIEDGILRNYIEKPTYHYTVSMGLYVFHRNILTLLDHDTYLDMPDLILRAQKHQMNIHCYQEAYEWLDIGRLDDYEQAITLFNDRKHDFLKHA